MESRNKEGAEYFISIRSEFFENDDAACYVRRNKQNVIPESWIAFIKRACQLGTHAHPLIRFE